MRAPATAGEGDRLYRGVWRALARWLRVPTEPPSLPLRAGEEAAGIRPAPGFLRYLRLGTALWGAAIGVPLLATALVLLWLEPPAGLLLLAGALLAGALFALAFVVLRFRYDATWYVLTDRSVRIRRGIWSLSETTVTFENVQNVRVRQGPLQRLCGIADVILETAGAAEGSGKSEGASADRAVIEGIAEPDRVRDLVLTRVRRSRSAGLGDEAAGEGRGTRWDGAHLEALREVRDAAAALAETRRGGAGRPADPGSPGAAT